MEKHRDRYGYTLRQDGRAAQKPQNRYWRRELELMTTHQLREICRRERIVNGVVDPLDKEALVRVILRYRGADEDLLIRRYDPDGMEALRSAVAAIKWHEQTDFLPECGAKIVVYNGAALHFYDGLTVKYHPKLVGTNALVVGASGRLCGVLNVEARGGGRDALYLTKAAEMPCEEAAEKQYSLLLMDRTNSQVLRRIYCGEESGVPDRLFVYRVPLLDFVVREPVALTMPAAIDFGAAGTAAGVYLDSLYFERRGLRDEDAGLREHAVNYAVFYDVSRDCRETALLPSAVGVAAVREGETPEYLFGYEALRLANSSYIDEGFCVFYDIKRWLLECEKREEIVDKEGRRTFVERGEILRAYFLHVIAAVRDRYKCRVDAVQILAPAKQKQLFQAALAKILPEYAADWDEALDEGTAVLYNAISELIAKGQVKEKQVYKALLLECGGGSADLSSYTFSVSNRRVSYRIEMEGAYENGDADFSGNRLTFRVMQLLKLKLFEALAPLPQREGVRTADEILAAFDRDVFRQVDECGVSKIYEALDEAYAKAEAVLPTQFRAWEQLSREAYYKVRNNFYFLFDTAERIKREFYDRVGTLRVLLTSEAAGDGAATALRVDKWKLSVRDGEDFVTVKSFPEICLSFFDVARVLRADIYGIVRKFLDEMYEGGELDDYTLVKLTGQSCKIALFREALKEFVPGKTIRFRRSAGDLADDLALKLASIDGALQYLRDKHYGYAAVRATSRLPRLPYVVAGYTHAGSEVVLLDGRRKGKRRGNLSRNMDDLTLKLFLKDMEGRQRYIFTYHCALDEFRKLRYEEIRELYGENIPQGDTDSIEGREVKFFVWTQPQQWGFLVVPVYRGAGQEAEMLMLGREQFFAFENEAWVENFFDGTK